MAHRIAVYGGTFSPPGLHHRRIAEELGCKGASQVRTLDEADAAILALSAARARRVGQIALIEAFADTEKKSCSSDNRAPTLS